MKLKKYLRQDFENYIRNKLIKDKCEICGSNKKLHLHHYDDTFSNIYFETLQELNMIEKDTHEYSPNELCLIRNVMLGKQIKIKYLTLCEKCHTNIHMDENSKKDYFNPFGNYIYVDTKEIKILSDYIPENILFEFIVLGCHSDYDGKIIYSYSGKRKRFSDSYKDIKEILNISNRKYYNIIECFKKYNLIFIKNNIIHINQKYIYRCKTNNKNSIKIFINNFLELYNSIQQNNHKTFGNIIKILYLINIENKISNIKLKDIMTFMGLSCQPSNFNDRIYKSCPDFIIMNKNGIYFNPKYIYKNTLNKFLKNDYYNFKEEFKNEILCNKK